MDRLNLFLEGILANLGAAVIVLDTDQQVQLWNSAATELWGLRSGEVIGVHFLSLDIGLPVDALRGALRGALAAEHPEPTDLRLEAVNRRGRSFTCQIRALPLRSRTGDNHGVILLMTAMEDGVAGSGSD
jgi:two-component system CheB/CheR fusion protein